MSHLRVAVVGVGHMGRLHAVKLRQLADVELVGVVDTNALRLAQVGRELQVPGAASVSALPAVDACVVAVPTTQHLVVAEALLSRGCHLLVEKPAALTGGEGQRLLERARASGCLVQVGHVERFNPAVIAAERATAGEVPSFVATTRLGPPTGRSLDVDVIDDLMIHDLDLCLRWFGAEVSHIRAVGAALSSGRTDVAHVWLEFGAGRSAVLHASRVAASTTRTIEWLGERRLVAIDLAAKQATAFARSGAAVAEALTVADSDALLAQDRAFVSACRQALRGQPDSNADQGGVDRGPGAADLASGVLAVRLAERIRQALRSPSARTTFASDGEQARK